MIKFGRRSFGFRAALLGLLLLITGCGGGETSTSTADGANGSSGTATGFLVIGLTDAEGEFARYRIRVGTLRLVEASGATVEIPLDLGVDFTDLVAITELLTVAELPAGNYRNLSVQLDFVDAEVIVQNPDGTLLAASLEDQAGAGLGIVEVAIELPTNGALDIVGGETRPLTLDFDLALSNERHPTDPSRVVVAPVVLALPALEARRPHRVHGLLREVALDAGVVGLDLRPFQRSVATPGALRFRVNEDTHYLIEGESFRGSLGLEQLAEQPVGTPVSAAGTVVDDTLVADRVLAGASVPGASGDSVRGVVLARSGDRVILGGAVVQRPMVAERFEQRLLLVLGPETRVALPHGGDIAGPEAVSVGSRLHAFGTLGGTEDGLTVLDASDGRVQLLDTGLTADVRSLDPVTVEVLLLAGRRPAAFDFSGTGTHAADDADPAAYVIAREAPISAEVAVGDLIRARGRIEDFGFAPPDFLAFRLTAAGDGPRRATLQALWPRPGTRTAFSGIGADRIGLDVSAARVLLRIAGVERDLLPGDGQIALVAAEVANPIFVVAIEGSGGQRQFRDFSALADAMLDLGAAGHSLLRIGTQGRYNVVTSTFEAERLQAVFAAPQAE